MSSFCGTLEESDGALYVLSRAIPRLGVQIEENPKESGGGVAVKNIMPDSNAERCLPEKKFASWDGKSG